MNVQEALNLLKENGYKYTNKREDMLQLFADSDRYLTAKNVLSALNDDYPGLSFDTIYRNLSLYEELGILKQLSCLVKSSSDLSVHSLITIIILFVLPAAKQRKLNHVRWTSFVMIWMAIRSAGTNLRFTALALIVQRKTKKTLLRNEYI